MTLIEVALAMVVGSLMTIPASMAVAHWARARVQSRLMSEAAVVAHLWLDRATQSQLPVTGDTEVVAGQRVWSLEWQVVELPADAALDADVWGEDVRLLNVTVSDPRGSVQAHAHRAYLPREGLE